MFALIVLFIIIVIDLLHYIKNMLASESISKAITDAHTNSTNYDATTLWIEAYNIVRNKVINAIVKAKQDYFWERVEFNLVNGQTEYNISVITWTPDLTIKEINKVFVKYDINDTYYTPVSQLAPSLMEKDPDYYSDNQSKISPFFNIKDKSVFIYPASDSDITEWWKLTVIYHPSELVITDDDTILDEDKQYIYSLWITEHIYKSQWKTNEAINANNQFKTELLDLTTEIKNRYNKPITKKFKNNLNDFR